MSEEQKVIKVSEVLQDLQNGLTREQIGEKLGLNKSQVARLFQHEKLKYKKTIKPDNFVVEDDTVTGDSEAASNQPELPLEGTQEVTSPEVVVQEVVSPISTWEQVTPEIEAAEAQADAHTQLGMQVEDDTTVSA